MFEFFENRINHIINMNLPVKTNANENTASFLTGKIALFNGG